MEKPSYFAVIPASVRYDKRLKPIERLLFGEITCLTNKDGYCFASSSYFAELYGVTRVSISSYISNLAKCGYIDVEIENKCYRKIFLKQGLNEILQGVKENEQGVKEILQGCENSLTPTCKKTFTQNNTSINNLTNNSKEEVEEEKPQNHKPILDAWNELPIANITGIRGKRLDSLRARLKEYSQDDILKAIRLIKKCPFLLGDNQRNWQITFDWFLKPNNFPKVLEGNYLPKEAEKQESLADISRRITEETEKARAEGQSMTPEEMKKKVIEEMKRKGMTIVGNSTPA